MRAEARGPDHITAATFPLSRTAGEGEPSAQRLVGEGLTARITLTRSPLARRPPSRCAGEGLIRRIPGPLIPGEPNWLGPARLGRYPPFFRRRRCNTGSARRSAGPCRGRAILLASPPRARRTATTTAP